MRCLILLAFVAIGSLGAAAPTIELKETTEEGKKMIVAQVSQDGKPLAGATVVISVERSFGNLILGEDQTLEDGSAAVEFPMRLPAGPAGKLKILAEIKPSGETSGAAKEANVQASSDSLAARAQLMAESAIAKEMKGEALPRALWAPKAPVPLLLSITAILVIVWGTYGFIGIQLIKIKQGGKT